MDMISVCSSNISSIGYTGDSLYIQFHKGGTYVYFNVPEAVYRGLLDASSHGRYFYDNIKGSYLYRKVS